MPPLSPLVRPGRAALPKAFRESPSESLAWRSAPFPAPLPALTSSASPGATSRALAILGARPGARAGGWISRASVTLGFSRGDSRGPGPNAASGSGSLPSGLLAGVAAGVPAAGSRLALGLDGRLPCGLSPSQMYELTRREITPEDYDLLLSLDEKVVASAATASRESIEALPAANEDDLANACCAVCLGSFGEPPSPGGVRVCAAIGAPSSAAAAAAAAPTGVAVLPCGHNFHRECIARWLTERRQQCPLCGRDAFSRCHLKVVVTTT